MKVLVVDDQESQQLYFRGVLQDLSPEISVATFGDPVEALEWSTHTLPDLLLLDYRMPNMDGLEFARRFREPLSHRDVPIVLITVVGDEPVRNAALDAGVMDYLVKPVKPRELRARLRNLIGLRRQHQSLKLRASSLEQQLLASIHEIETRERELLLRLSKATEYREGSKSSRLERMSRYTGVLCEALGLSDEEIRLNELAAPLHDIGKIGIPDAVLLKPGPLTDAEREVVRRHVVIGHDLLANSRSRFLRTAAEIALRHHEHWDGNGYPDGLRREAIPLPARIVAVADVFDALTSERPFREAWSIEAAFEHVRDRSGTQFDPDCVAALLSERDRIVEVLHYFGAEPLGRSH
ncbi:MAG TPA: HD domain-containing phosphohydrolase [Xanthomonadaceae bacterium]|nr:HD domain-containing phosphohydrolase [Xanthomonadaceae bacterium]